MIYSELVDMSQSCLFDMGEGQAKKYRTLHQFITKWCYKMHDFLRLPVLSHGNACLAMARGKPGSMVWKIYFLHEEGEVRGSFFRTALCSEKKHDKAVEIDACIIRSRGLTNLCGAHSEPHLKGWLHCAQ